MVWRLKKFRCTERNLRTRSSLIYMEFVPNSDSPAASNGSGSGRGGGGGPVRLVTVTVTGAASSSGAGAASAASSPSSSSSPSRYESQKRRDWNTFGQYLRNHRPPLSLSHCSSAHVLEFLRYLDQFGKTKIHAHVCPFFGRPTPAPAPCACPLRQAWGSLDALIGRLRAAYEENGGKPETNPFAARAVRLYLREVREFQSRARGISYEKKKSKKHHHPPPPPPPPPTAA